ncbi:GtrA family protein [Loktanella agnita]|uniref:GtrA family protein n=1 Tax=Loktanella agnita TaxID=287097 RepID=UPI0039898D00
MLPQLLRFGVVGGVGFIVDAGMIWLLLTQGLNPFVARALSFPAAVLVTWALNRSWTFATGRTPGRIRELRSYVAVQLTGAAVNYSAYSLVVGIFGAAPIVIFGGVVLGSFIGLFVNFWGARRFVFIGEPPKSSGPL